MFKLIWFLCKRVPNMCKPWQTSLQLSSGAVAQGLGLSCSDSGHGAFALSQSEARFRGSAWRFDYVWSDKFPKFMLKVSTPWIAHHASETIQNMHPVCFFSVACFFLNHPWNITKSMKSMKSNVAIKLAKHLVPRLHSILPSQTRIQGFS